MARYNHAYTLAFSLVSNDDKGHDVDARQLKAALLARIENLDEEGSWIESAGAPYDTYLARIIHPVEFGALSFKHLASSEHT